MDSDLGDDAADVGADRGLRYVQAGGDLTDKNFGLDDARYQKLVHSIDSIIHCAASLNRKSNKACFNVNLRGTLSVIKLARDASSWRRKW